MYVRGLKVQTLHKIALISIIKVQSSYQALYKNAIKPTSKNVKYSYKDLFSKLSWTEC